MKLKSRRNFLKQTSLAAAALAVAAPWRARAGTLADHPGLQLYTVGKDLAADPAGTLAQVAAIGYRTVETAGTAGKTATEFRKTLDAAGLDCRSSHLYLPPGQTFAQFFDEAKTLGSEYVVSSFLVDPNIQPKSADDFFKYAASLTEDDFKKLADQINKLAAQAKTVGLKFAYHNHNLEFRTWPDGSTPYDSLVAATDASLVKLELDCGWAELAGRSPLALFKRYPGRFRMLHIKDFVAVPHPIVTMSADLGVEWTELGRGRVDYRAILAAAPSAGVEHIFVEQEPPFVKYTPLQAAKVDFDYLQSIR
jgi:sugar phosphate isomerase/epimerase